jgi:hypothetical protein
VVPIQMIITLLILLTVRDVYASDWQFCSYMKKGNNEFNLFFNAEDIKFPSKGLVKVWVKSINIKDIDRYIKKHEQDVMDKFLEKFASGYTPKFYKLEVIKSKYNDKETLAKAAIDTMTDEVVANAAETKTSIMMYLEIDCSEKRWKVLMQNGYR